MFILNGLQAYDSYSLVTRLTICLCKPKSNKLVAEFAEFTEREIVIAPPFTALYPVAQVLRDSPIHLSAQNVHWNENGAYTGETSAQML